jgi:glycosyl hydrolase family 10/fibronectin type III domain protein
VVSWDVVNEVFDDNGGMRSSFWFNTLGQSFVADAFRAADSNARLCINDYNVEGINAKSTAMYNLVSSLRQQGVPVDCVGYRQKPSYTAVHDALAGGTTTDPTPPTTPGTPTAGNVTSNSASLTWTASTDSGGSGLAGYNVYREQGTTDTQLGQSTTNSISLTGLSPSTQYQVYVRARDGAGNLSANSALTTFTTIAGPDSTLAAGGSTGFGFQVSRPNGDTQTPSGYACA